MQPLIQVTHNKMFPETNKILLKGKMISKLMGTSMAMLETREKFIQEQDGLVITVSTLQNIGFESS